MARGVATGAAGADCGTRAARPSVASALREVPISSVLDTATARLDAAIAQLEGAIARHFDADARKSDLETELQIMGDDRARLAVELDSATAELGRVRSAAEGAGHRVDGAIAAIRTVLARSPADGP